MRIVAPLLVITLSFLSLCLSVDRSIACDECHLSQEQREILRHMSIVFLDDGKGGRVKTIRLSKVNLQLVNGLGATNGDHESPLGSTQPMTNGLGNLIVGYSEEDKLDTTPPRDRTGSHNIVIGPLHTYSSYGGLVAGSGNSILAGNSSAVGGQWNRASGRYSSVLGGITNKATGISSTVAGGSFNTADGGPGTVSGGSWNVASGPNSTVSGGFRNVALFQYSVVGGGQWNVANGFASSVQGGGYNSASGEGATVAGGRGNAASGMWSAISGGSGGSTKGEFDWLAGDLFQDE